MKHIQRFAKYFAIGTLLVSCSKDQQNNEPPPIANFSYTASGRPLYKVDFEVIAPTPGATYRWDYGDGMAWDGVASTRHYYATDYHIYQVQVNKLSTTDSVKRNIDLSQIGSFSPQSPQTLDFTYKVTASPPYTVTFTNKSKNAVSSTWDFGDNNKITSNMLMVLHTYTTEGSFPVKLVVKNNLGLTDSITTVLQLAL